MPLPHPQKVMDSGLEVHHYPNAAMFRKFGGRTEMPKGYGTDPDRFVVVAMPGTYDPSVDVPNAMEAISAYWNLFQDGGWTVFVWDREEKEGWSWDWTGPGFEDYIYEHMGLPIPGKGATQAKASDSNLLSKFNRYRAWQGKPAAGTGEWSDEDMREFLSHAPTQFQNPGPSSTSALKRKLLR